MINKHCSERQHAGVSVLNDEHNTTVLLGKAAQLFPSGLPGPAVAVLAREGGDYRNQLQTALKQLWKETRGGGGGFSQI